MLRYRRILFDADNTLFNFNRCEHDAVRDALFEAGIRADEQMIADYSAVNDRMWKMLERGEITKTALRVERFAQFCRLYNLPLDVNRIAKSYTEKLSEKAYLIDGAQALCHTLYDAGCELYIITNGLQAVQKRRFSSSPLSGYFSGVFISEEVGFEKPDRSFFDEVRRRTAKMPSREILVVGDSLSSDMAGGIGAGLDTCWFNPAGKKNESDLPVTYTVRELSDILPIILVS